MHASIRPIVIENCSTLLPSTYVATVERMHSNTNPEKPVTNMVAARMTIAVCEVRVEIISPGLMNVPYSSAAITSAIPIWPHATTDEVATVWYWSPTWRRFTNTYAKISWNATRNRIPPTA